MKKLGKLKINPEKRINNEELVALRGGYDALSWYTCSCYDEYNTYFTEDIRLYDWAIDRYLESTCWDGHTGSCTPI